MVIMERPDVVVVIGGAMFVSPNDTTTHPAVHTGRPTTPQRPSGQ
jgi:hypothetical protein